MAARTEAERVRTDPRISRRRKAIVRSKRRRVMAALIAAGIAAVLVWTAFWSPLLDVRRIQVVGAKHTDSSDVRAATGLDSNENLLLVSTGRVAASVEELPWVRAADVQRRLPGTVRVKVEERSAALVVTVASGTWTIDASGHVLEEGAASERLPTLTGTVLAGVEPGERIRSEAARAGLEVWRSLPRKIKEQVASVVAPARVRIALALRDGTVVRYGGADHLGAKNEVLGALLARLRAEHRTATYIDISVPGTPAVGPPQAMPTASPTPIPTI